MQHWLIVLCLSFAAITGDYQERPAQGRDAVVERNIFNTLFDGIQLESAADSNARRIIKEARARQLKMNPIDTQAKWAAMLANIDKRDSLLRLLISRPADRARFDRQAKAFRPVSQIR